MPRSCSKQSCEQRRSHARTVIGGGGRAIIMAGVYAPRLIDKVMEMDDVPPAKNATCQNRRVLRRRCTIRPRTCTPMAIDRGHTRRTTAYLARLRTSNLDGGDGGWRGHDVGRLAAWFARLAMLRVAIGIPVDHGRQLRRESYRRSQISSIVPAICRSANCPRPSSLRRLREGSPGAIKYSIGISSSSRHFQGVGFKGGHFTQKPTKGRTSCIAREHEQGKRQRDDMNALR